MQDVGERVARDAVTGEKYKIPSSMTYEQWKAQQDAKHGEGTVDKMRKSGYNYRADKMQFERYKACLASNAPRTFEEFQALKYSDDWGLFKAYTRAIKSDELTPLADFKLYKATSAQIDEAIVGKVASNGLLVTNKSAHFIARSIGSVEQRRNGVSVETSLNTLLHPKKVSPIKYNENGPSHRFIGEDAAVTINPDTGVLIQVNPIKHEKEEKV